MDSTNCNPGSKTRISPRSLSGEMLEETMRFRAATKMFCGDTSMP